MARRLTDGQDDLRLWYTGFDLPFRTEKRNALGVLAATEFHYDAFGTRAAKAGPERYTIYVGGGLYEKRVTELGSGQAAKVEHVFSVRAESGPVAQVTRDQGAGTERVTYIQGDALGSATTLLSADGEVEQIQRFDPWGHRVDEFGAPVTDNPAHPVTRGFTGHEHDDELGRINMNGRLYDPRLRRMLSGDPLVSSASADGWNPYVYALNTPTAFTDPTGFSPDSEKPPPTPPEWWVDAGGTPAEWAQHLAEGNAALEAQRAAEHSTQKDAGEATRGPEPAPQKGPDGGPKNGPGPEKRKSSDPNDRSRKPDSSRRDVYHVPALLKGGNRVDSGFSFGGSAEVSDGSRTRPVTTGVGVERGIAVARSIASIGIGFLPVVGTVQSLVELATGMDYVTGEQTNRALAAVGVVAGLFGLKGLLKGGAAAAKAARGIGLGVKNTATALRSASEAYKDTTRLGHALSKHAGRNPDIWGKVTGNQSTWHNQALQHFRDILRGPGSFQRVTNSKGTTFLEKMLPDGRGVRLQLDYRFKGFID